MGATIKEPMRVVTAYTFLGCEFDHERRTVRVASKTLRKLPDTMPESMRACDLEAHNGRLIHCNGITGAPFTNEKYLASKWAARRCSDMNRGTLDPTALVTIPRAVRRGYDAWLIDARRTRVIASPRAGGDNLTLFTDASLRGYGAILVTGNNEYTAHAGEWARDDGLRSGLRLDNLTSGDICTLEARAVRHAVDYWRDAIANAKSLELVVDNTSVEAAIKRGYGRSPALNSEIAPVIEELRRLNVIVTARYIKSADNPADALSRGQDL